MKNITINGKEYKIKPIDFNALCELEESGFVLADAPKQTFKTLRALCAVAMGCDIVDAGKEIEEHIASGGSIADLKPLFDNLVESDFFRNLSH